MSFHCVHCGQHVYRSPLTKMVKNTRDGFVHHCPKGAIRHGEVDPEWNIPAAGRRAAQQGKQATGPSRPPVPSKVNVAVPVRGEGGIDLG